MAIIQISKIQQRAGDLVDLPQLDEAEFGFASDEKRLFIGKEDPNENIEVLTSYSEISFGQLEGAVGNLEIDPVTVANGQVLVYDGNNWINRGGEAGGFIDLGDVSNLKISGGTIGYVLETDGTGNVSWQPKGALLSLVENIILSPDSNISNLENATTVVTTEDNLLTNSAQITITDIPGVGTPGTVGELLSGSSYYVKVISANTFQLFLDLDLTIPIISYGLTPFPYTAATATQPANDRVLVVDAAQFNVDDPVQFVGNLNSNTSGIFANTVYFVDSKDFGNTWITLKNSDGDIVPLGDTSITANVYVPGGRVVSLLSLGNGTLAGGSNTTIQFNNKSLLDGSTNFVYDFTNSIFKLTGLANITGNMNVSGNIVVSNVSGANLISANFISGTLTTSAQPNITSVGTLTSLAVAGNVTAGNVYANSGTFGASLLTGTLTTNAQPNITSVGTLTSLSVSGTLNTTTISTGANTTSGNLTGNWILTSGSRLQATYADLAEYYASDKHYPAGTVLDFGGECEVTLAGIESNKIAGVVSADPAYVMNGMIKCDHPVTIALQGRVPCKVKGKVHKGDMMVSSGDGFAKAATSEPKMGTVIGKSLTNFDGEEGIVEVVVGRL